MFCIQSHHIFLSEGYAGELSLAETCLQVCVIQHSSFYMPHLCLFLIISDHRRVTEDHPTPERRSAEVRKHLDSLGWS